VIALLVAGSIVAGTVSGWYGHKASLRIQAWGLKMNDQDRIFRFVTNLDDREDYNRGYQNAEADLGSLEDLGNPHLPLDVATSK
jgi:hypothetical protein